MSACVVTFRVEVTNVPRRTVRPSTLSATRVDGESLQRARDAAARALGLPVERVKVVVLKEGGRPRKVQDAATVEAAVEREGSLAAAARVLGVAESTLRRRRAEGR